MSGFVFDFGSPAEEPVVSGQQQTASTANHVATLPFVVYGLPELNPTVPAPLIDAPLVGDMQFLETHVPTGRVILHRRAPRVDDLELANGVRCDIVPGAYFGGLKVWSCAPDLAAEICSKSGPFRNQLQRCVAGQRLRVVELGCGQALPTVAALGTMLEEGVGGTVYAHDYNIEVLRECTLPNLRKNFSASQFVASTNVALGAGDWDSLSCSDLGGAADVILGADVTFDDEATRKALQCIDRLLAPGGFALVGTKQYYFGTGGGLVEMERFIAASHIPLSPRVLWEGGEGSMRRAIVLLSRP